MGDGRSALFWDDMWHHYVLKHKFDHLHSFIRDPLTNVQQVINTEYLQDLFHLPLTTQAYEEFIQMEDICTSLRQSKYLDAMDTWIYICVI